MTEFFMPMIPPTVTHQMHRASQKSGKLCFYDSPQLKDARAKLIAHLGKHVPQVPYKTAVRLVVKWLFPKGKHSDGEWKITRPDTDNLQKLLKDCMTECGFFTDDALVCSEIIEKFWAQVPGIYVRLEEL